MSIAMLEVRFRVGISEVPEPHRMEAERRAEEAFVLSLLRQGDISAGRAAGLLGIDRWQLDDLMAAHAISPFDDSLTAEEIAQEAEATRKLLARQP